MPSIQQATREAACGHETIHRFHVESADVGTLGFVDGGKLLEWIDEAAHATAAQWCGRRCVTASVGNVHLDRPISVGELVEVQASLVYTGCCSMHILVTICSSDLSQAYPVQTSQCSIVFVAVDESGHPVEVPRWTPVTMLELQRQRQARVRMRTRKRIDDAMDAESYTAEGTASSAALPRPSSPPTRSTAAASCGGSTKLPTLRSRLGWRPSHHVLRRRDLLLPPHRHRRRHRGHRASHPHGTAQHPHQCPRHQSRRNPCRTWTHGRRRTRRARPGQTCPAVAARLRRRPSTRSARPAPDRATATDRTLHHCNRIPRSGLTETV